MTRTPQLPWHKARNLDTLALVAAGFLALLLAVRCVFAVLTWFWCWLIGKYFALLDYSLCLAEHDFSADERMLDPAALGPSLSLEGKQQQEQQQGGSPPSSSPDSPATPK